jgi:peptidoglycan/xylan/chitin deacetylase (PgdA/CDA1 family)
MLISITFDDGYISQLKMAKTLAQLGIRVTFFIITQLRSFEGKPLLTIKEEYIAELTEMCHEVGSHTATHKVLTDLDRFELEEELKNSKRYLEDVIGNEVLGFAYPYGLYNLRVIQEVAKYYYYARATDILPSDNPLNIRVRSRYVIGSASVKTVGKVLLYMINPAFSSHIKPVLFLHHMNSWRYATLYSIISVLQRLGAKFVTMRELVEAVEKHEDDVNVRV